ncbi:MAG: thiol:disulfide interchange protein DsbA/DsbL [Formivibrio sp.]|nr:thiol:disulfide interchange protein DsbA/DsbL [Formivibrio sp.]
MFKNCLKTIVLVTGLLAAGASQAALKEGKDYTILATPHALEVPGKQEVIEFFWYGCPHCYKIEPYVDAWAKKLPPDVNFRRIHVMWPGRPDIEAHAKLFVALQEMGIETKYELAVFDAVQRDRIELRKEGPLFDWLKKQGIDQAKFKANYGSFSSSLALKKIEQLSKDYAVDGVPEFIVNGKYVTSPAMLGKEDGSITQAVDELLAQGRKKTKK